MKISFPVLEPLAKELYLYLGREGYKHEIKIIFGTESMVVESFLAKNDINVYYMRKKILDSFKEQKKILLDKKLEKISSYKVNVNYLTFSDPFLSKKSYEYRINFLLAYLAVWEVFFEKFKPDIALSSDGRETFVLAYGVIAKKNNVKLLVTNGSSIFPNKSFFSSNIFLTDCVNAVYYNEKVDKKESIEISSYINKMKEERPIIGGKRKAIFSTKRIRNALRYWWICIIKEQNKLPYYNLKDSLEWAIVPRFGKILSRKYYSKVKNKEKFYFFPLQAPYDSQTILRTPQFTNQRIAIEMCASCLPEGYYLYVKEHPHALGHYSPSDLQKIVQLPNVRLVSPYINAHDLIKASVGVITINSDVGWEALLYRKPVIVLAKPFYSGLGLTLDVECFKYFDFRVVFDKNSIKRLRKLILESLNFSIDEESIYKLINATKKSSYPGYFFIDSYGAEYNTVQTNVKNILKSIKNAVKEF